ncbi:MAG: hypothetical protein WDO73_35010 [Ignavibacteriota bacterium]
MKILDLRSILVVPARCEAHARIPCGSLAVVQPPAPEFVTSHSNLIAMAAAPSTPLDLAADGHLRF